MADRRAYAPVASAPPLSPSSTLQFSSRDAPRASASVSRAPPTTREAASWAPIDHHIERADSLRYTPNQDGGGVRRAQSRRRSRPNRGTTQLQVLMDGFRYQAPAWSWLWFFGRVLAYNMGNVALGMAALAVVVVELALSLLLLPLCCFGVVLFRSLLRTVALACQADVRLHNLLASGPLQIQMDSQALSSNTYSRRTNRRNTSNSTTRRSRRWERSPLLPTHHPSLDSTLTPPPPPPPAPPRFEPTLNEPSPRSLLALLYFGSLKFLLAIFSAISLALFQFSVLSCSGSPDVQFGDVVVNSHQLLRHDSEWWFAVALAGLVVSFGLLYLVARVALITTRFVCCQVDEEEDDEDDEDVDVLRAGLRLW